MTQIISILFLYQSNYLYKVNRYQNQDVFKRFFVFCSSKVAATVFKNFIENKNSVITKNFEFLLHKTKETQRQKSLNK